MAAKKITWEQFKVCSNDAQGVRMRFEDLCRQLFINEFLAENEMHRYVHCNPNNPGLESEPVYDEKNERLIGYQVKFFDTSIDYGQILESAKNVVKYYSGKVEHVYLFCNKSITVNCKSYENIVTTLGDAGITIEPIADNTVLDLARKYSYLGLYYFEQHSLSMEWFWSHTTEIKSKLGERYNSELNVDTRASYYLSLFVHDKKAVECLNEKKAVLLDELNNLGWQYDVYKQYTDKVREIVSQIKDVRIDTIMDALDWEQVLLDGVKKELEKLQGIEDKICEERDLYRSCLEKQGRWAVLENDEKNVLIHKKLVELEQELDKIQNVVRLSKILKLSTTERAVLNGEILLVEGQAGVGKSHMFANETIELLGDNRYALLLVGGDYFDNSTVHEQIMKNLRTGYSFEELIDILEGWGAEQELIVPVLIDALNETWNVSLWKSGLPAIINKIKETKFVRLAVTFRDEYKKQLIDESNITSYGICEIQHSGFAENSMEAAYKFLNHYEIPFTPIHFFSANITNPLFLTLYCKTYQGDEVELPVLYERILQYANVNIHKTLSEMIRKAGYDVSEDLVTPVISAIAEFILDTGRKILTLQEITEMPVWENYGLNARPFIIQLIRENILHDYAYENGKRVYFAYDQMNDFYCAKVVISRYRTKDAVREFLIKKVLCVSGGEITNYGNRDLFINVCALYAEQFHEEGIDVIDEIGDEIDRRELFNRYVDSLQWRTCITLSKNQLLELFDRYMPRAENVWEMFIANSVKIGHPLNAEALHEILMSYPLYDRDYMWTMYINHFDSASEHRLVQLIKMYNAGKSLEFTDEKQIDLLLTMLGWCLTASNRWLRDITSKAMIEILRVHFSSCEKILVKFQDVNDPYVIQRLYGVICGACMKRIQKEQKVYKALVDYIYKTLFNQDMVCADILLRDYARLIIERFFYEYPEEKENYDYEKIIPPYISEDIPEISDQGYLQNDFPSGISAIIRSMRFEGMGMYGDFGRYVFQAAVSNFDIDNARIFNYAVNFILNELGYDAELFGEYDRNIGRYSYNRHNTAKIERIGKKYQWIAMYNILARVSDNYDKTEGYGQEKTKLLFEGAWDPYVRDFDPTLNENSMVCPEVPKFECVKVHMEAASEENVKAVSEDEWLDAQSAFFGYQKEDLVLNGSDGQKWIVLTKHAEVRREKKASKKFVTWNWIYGYFVTEEQRNILLKYSDTNVNLLNNDIICIPETYILFSREFPWAPSSKSLKEYSWREIEIKTGEKKTVTETYEMPDFSDIEKLLKQYSGSDSDDDIIPGISKIEISLMEQMVTREIDITEDIGNILSATVNLLWEEEYDASKENTISYRVPCAELLETLELSQQLYDGYYYDKDGKLAAFDTALNEQEAGMVIRKDLLDEFLKKKNMKLVWFVNGSKEIHLNDSSIDKWSDWTGLLMYDGEKVNGEVFKAKYPE